MRRFASRTTAGRALGAELRRRGIVDAVVLALPRGGVPVAVEVARALHAPLDLVLVRKIGAPDQPELAVAAVVDGDPPQIVINDDVLAECGLGEDDLAEPARMAGAEIARRRRVYLGARPRVAIAGRTVIMVDDGIATGVSLRAAVQGVRRQGPARVVLAVPVAPASVVAELAAEGEEVVCLATPEPFEAVGRHYLDFHQLTDIEVQAALAAFDARPGPA